ARGIVHRDLKPENLFVTREGVLKVLDFGIARLEESAGTPSQTLGVMGTPSFMAPEQARGRWQDVDGRSDLWALGATMFTLFCGRFVHQAETVNETLVMAATQRAPSSAQIAPDIHPMLAEVVDKALAYERELRFQTAAEFRAALRAVHLATGGEESLLVLAAPHASRGSLAEPSAASVTMGGGVAASVRSAHAASSASTSQRSKTSLFLFGLAALCGLGFLATRLVRSEVKHGPYLEATRAGAPSELALLVRPEAPASVVTVAAPAPLDLASSGAPQQVREIPARLNRAPRVGGITALAQSKPHAAKVAIDPFLKRH
ncbi:MAG: serine/threonine-protein kinase, partial [Pseudomonadota bacterium]